jgi:hypothetical protein
MSARRIFSALVVFVCVLILIGCAASKISPGAFSEGLIGNKSVDHSDAAVELPSSGGVGLSNAGGAAASGNGIDQPLLPTSAAPATGQSVGSEGSAGQVPLIIKQGQVRLQVKDTDQAIDRLTQIVSDTHGYIISNRIWFEQVGQESYKYATYTIGVPVDGFETALRRLRSLAVKVVDETASGQDVSEEYTDLESRLRNLEATRDRIRSFLAQAQSVEESLRINNELAAIEDQIEQVQGRMRYLSSRAAYSTITIQFDPELPAAPTPTPTPEPVPYTWDPGKTFQQASSIAIKVGQAVVDLLIYLVVWVPFAIPVFLVWLVYRIVTGKRKITQP